MKVLGCTGGIGSGKSYVSAIFGKMGIPVYDSDNRAKSLYDTDLLLRKSMVGLLGEEIVKDGVVQRDVIAAKIFGNRQLLEEVECLVHPAVIRDFDSWKQCIADRALEAGEHLPPFVIMESAILLEKPIVRASADKVLVVSAPLELRIERVMARDNTDRSRVMARIASQWSDEQRRVLADFIIFADGKQALLPQVETVYSAMVSVGAERVKI